MSYEGRVQCLCSKGHYWEYGDGYWEDDGDCPECGIGLLSLFLGSLLGAPDMLRFCGSPIKAVGLSYVVVTPKRLEIREMAQPQRFSFGFR